MKEVVVRSEKRWLAQLEALWLEVQLEVALVGFLLVGFLLVEEEQMIQLAGLLAHVEVQAVVLVEALVFLVELLALLVLVVVLTLLVLVEVLVEVLELSDLLVLLVLEGVLLQLQVPMEVLALLVLVDVLALLGPVEVQAEVLQLLHLFHVSVGLSSHHRTNPLPPLPPVESALFAQSNPRPHNRR